MNGWLGWLIDWLFPLGDQDGQIGGFSILKCPGLRCGEGPEGGKRNKQTGMQHLDVGATRLLRQRPESRRRKRMKGRWTCGAAGQHTAGGNAAEASSRGRPMQMRIGLMGWMVCLSLLVAQWPRRRARPRFSQIELDPLVEPRIGIRVVGIIRPSPWIALSPTGRPGQSRQSGRWFARSRAKRRRLEVS